MRQIKFEFMDDFKNSFGGSLLEGKRKSARALSTKNPIHLILKTSAQRVFTPGNRSLERLIFAYASKYKIKIQRISLNWTHTHMIILIPTRAAYKAFIRTLTGLKRAATVALHKFRRSSLACPNRISRCELKRRPFNGLTDSDPKLRAAPIPKPVKKS